MDKIWDVNPSMSEVIDHAEPKQSDVNKYIDTRTQNIKMLRLLFDMNDMKITTKVTQNVIVKGKTRVQDGLTLG